MECLMLDLRPYDSHQSTKSPYAHLLLHQLCFGTSIQSHTTLSSVVTSKLREYDSHSRMLNHPIIIYYSTRQLCTGTIMQSCTTPSTVVAYTLKTAYLFSCCIIIPFADKFSLSVSLKIVTYIFAALKWQNNIPLSFSA